MSRSMSGFGQIRALLLVILVTLAFAAPGVRASDETPAAIAMPGCDLPPRSLDEITALLATPAPPEPERSGVLPMGEPLRPGEQIALEEAVRRFIACRNAGEPLRLYTLFTDRYLLRLLSGEPSPVDVIADGAIATPRPAAAGSAELVEITAGRRMADGRLGALVTIDTPSAPRPETFFFVFLPRGAEALIDDIRPVPAATSL